MGVNVSVVLPVRNAATTLDECLASLEAQTLTDHEVVVVDDGSTDGCHEILARWRVRDPRVRVVTTPPRGLVPALNLGVARARGPYVARMDGDDLAAPERLEQQASRLRADPDVDILASRVALVDGGVPGSAGMRRYVGWTNTLLDHEQILCQRFVDAPLVHPSVMMRREALLALGGYRAFGGPEDYDLWLRAAERGLRFAKLPGTLLFWRDGPSRLTRTDARYSPEAFLKLKLDVLLRGPLAHDRPVVVWGAGPIGKSWAQALRARGHPLLAFVDVAPRRIGRVIHGVPVVGLEAVASLQRALHLAAVGQAGARDRIRAAAARLGLEEGRDLLAVA